MERFAQANVIPFRDWPPNMSLFEPFWGGVIEEFEPGRYASGQFTMAKGRLMVWLLNVHTGFWYLGIRYWCRIWVSLRYNDWKWHWSDFDPDYHKMERFAQANVIPFRDWPPNMSLFEPFWGGVIEDFEPDQWAPGRFTMPTSWCMASIIERLYRFFVSRNLMVVSNLSIVEL